MSATRQIQSSVVERAEINAGNSVIAEMIANSTTRCDGTVYAMTGPGMIAGSLIRTGNSILCLQIGSPAGERNHFSVGYPPHSLESWNQLRAELSILDDVLRKKSSGRIHCEKLHPFLEVQIGRLTQEIATVEENCNIRVVDSWLFLR